MPQDLGAEAAVLGSMIVDPRCIGDVVEMLKRDAFYHTEHQLIFDAIIALFEKNRGEGIDGLLVRNELERCNQMEAIGGAEYLQRILETVPSSANVQYYAEIVQEKMLLRETIAAATEILHDAYDESGDGRREARRGRAEDLRRHGQTHHQLRRGPEGPRHEDLRADREARRDPRHRAGDRILRAR